MNEFAVSAGQVGEGLSKSASVLAEGGATIQEAAGMFVGINEVIQDASTAGNTLKIMTLRIRGMKGKLEELGEEVDDNIDGVSKIQTQLLNLTHGKVNIFDDKGNFRDIYNIMQDIAGVYDSLTDTEKAATLELIAGKNRANGVAALLRSWDQVEEATRRAYESEGTAERENEIYVKSLQGRLDTLKATWQAFSADFVSSDLLKFGVTAVTKILDIIDKVIQKFGALKTILVATFGFFATNKFLSTASDLGGFDGTIDGFKLIAKEAFPILSKLKGGIKDVVSAFASAENPAKGFISALSVVPPIGWIALIAGGITAAALAYDYFTISAEEANDIMRDSETSFKESNKNVETLERQFNEANDAYNSLLAQGKWTPIEQAELERLRQTTSELQLQLDIEKELQKSNARDLMDDTTSAFNKNFKNGIDQSTMDSYSNNDAIVSSAISGDQKNISAQLVAIQKLDKLKKDAEDEYRKAIADGNETEAKYALQNLNDYKEQQNDLKSNIWEQMKLLSEYKKNLQSIPEDMIKGTDAEEVLNTINESIDFVYQKLEPGKYLTMKYDEIFKNDSFRRAKEELLSLAQSSDGAGISVSDLTSKYPELAQALQQAGFSAEDFVNEINASATATDNAGDSVEEYADKMYNSMEKVLSLREELDKTNKALSSITTGQSVDYDSAMGDLYEYSDALEYHNGTMRYNLDMVEQITAAKIEETRATIENNKAMDQSHYLENVRKIQEMRGELINLSGDEKVARQIAIDNLVSENAELAESYKNYDILTVSLNEAASAYNKWINAQKAPQSGDMFDSSLKAMQKINDTLNNSNSDDYNRIGNADYKAALGFIIPESVDTEDKDAINKYMESIQKYIKTETQEKDSGKKKKGDVTFTGLDTEAFLKDAVSKGLMIADESGENFKLAGEMTMQQFADGMGLAIPLVQAMFGELEEFGKDFTFQSDLTRTFGDLAMSAGEAYESIRAKTETPIELALDVSNFENSELAIKKLDENIVKMNNYKARPDVDASDIENANTIIQYCVAQKQLLSQPTIMSVDTSGVTDDIGHAIELLQEFQAVQDQIDAQKSIGADTSEAQAKLESLTAEINGLNKEVKTKVGIEVDGQATAEQISSVIAGLDQEALVTIGVDASAIEGYQETDLSKDATVKWDNNTSAVDSYAKSTKNAKGIVAWTNNTLLVKTRFTADGWINWKNTIAPLSGEGDLNGTAHLNGTAYAGGNWGTTQRERALVGELG